MGLYCLANELSTFKNKSAMKVRVIRTGFVMEKKGSSEIKGKEVIFHEEDEEGKHNKSMNLTLLILSIGIGAAELFDKHNQGSQEANIIDDHEDQTMAIISTIWNSRYGIHSQPQSASTKIYTQHLQFIPIPHNISPNSSADPKPQDELHMQSQTWILIYRNDERKEKKENCLAYLARKKAARNTAASTSNNFTP
nr:uncharacterized protein LOC109174218 [Ipomoea batatas]